MRNVKIYSYNLGSAGAAALARSLNVLRLRDTGRPIRTNWLINWGSSGAPEQRQVVARRVLNPFNNVKTASSKLLSFQALAQDAEINLPPWTTSAENAKEFGTVVVRAVLNGHSGNGITIINEGDAIPRAPLYTGYIKKKHEFRVHIMNGEVIDIQQKRKRRDFEGEADNQVRNHAYGWVYCREDLEVPDDLQRQACKAVAALGLDFGAVDLIYNQRQDTSYVLEVNTAPGLEGTTLEKYVEGFQHHYLRG